MTCPACGNPDHGPGETCPAEGISALWSPDFDAYASGELPADRVRCALCLAAPCECPPFGIPEYFAPPGLGMGTEGPPGTGARHGRKSGQTRC